MLVYVDSHSRKITEKCQRTTFEYKLNYADIYCVFFFEKQIPDKEFLNIKMRFEGRNLLQGILNLPQQMLKFFFCTSVAVTKFQILP